MRSTTLALGLAAALAAFSPSAAPAEGTQAAEQERLDAMIKRYIEAHPDVVFNAVNAYVADQHAAKRREADAKVLGAAQELTGGTGTVTLGKADAPLSVAYVLDVACAYCRRTTPVLDGVLARNPDLKIVQRFVPFLSRDSDYGGRVAMIVASRYPGRYPAFYDTLMGQSGKADAAMVDRVLAETVGEDAAPLVRSDAVAPDNAWGRDMAANDRMARRLGIEGTPFVMVVGAGEAGVFRGAETAERIQAAVDAARAAHGR